MNRSSSAIGGAIVTVVVFILGGLFVWMWGAQTGHGLWHFFRSAFPVLIPVLILGVLASIAALVDSAVGATLAIIPAAIWLVAGGSVINHVSNHHLASHTVVKDGEANSLDFRERTPFDVASAVSNRTLGDTTGTATGHIKSIPAAGESGAYTTLVVRRGMGVGYERLQEMSLPFYGTTKSSDVKFCEFSQDASLRFGGALPSNNLARAIAWKTSPSTTADESDMIMRCEDDTPMLYVPLVRMNSNFFAPTPEPAGAAVYNGKTGELSVKAELNVPGLPLYPQSLAKRQREATHSSQGYWDKVFSRAGYEDTSADGDDPNGNNRAEFGLTNPEGTESYFVSPLTPRGSSTSITAVGTIRSDAGVKAGHVEDFTIHTYPSGQPRQANSAIASSIVSEQLEGYKATGLSVFEIVPATDGSWIASIGKEQSVRYRAIIKADGTTTLHSIASGTAGQEPTVSEGEPGPSTGKPVADMSETELRELGAQILDELAKRAGEGN